MPETQPSTPEEEPKQARAKLPLNPIDALNQSIQAVPAMKYALAVLGVVAVVAIITAWRLDFRVAVFGAVIILVLMVAVLIFARLTKLAPRYFIAPALFFMWTFVTVTVATGIALFTAATMRWPPAVFELIFERKIPSPLPSGATSAAIIRCKVLNYSGEMGNILIALVLPGGEPADQAWVRAPAYEARLKVSAGKSFRLTASGKQVKPNAFSDILSPSSGGEVCYGLELWPFESSKDGRCYPVESCDDLDSANPVPAGTSAPTVQPEAVVSTSQLRTVDLFHRIVLLTASLESGSSDPEHVFTNVYGNFDGQGITIGFIGFTWLNGEIQDSLTKLQTQSPGVLQRVFKEEYPELTRVLGSAQSAQVAWARHISTANGESLIEPWLTRFRELGRQNEFQQLEYDRIRMSHYAAALQLHRALHLHSERALALTFDISVQNARPTEEMLAEINRAATNTNPENEEKREIAVMESLAKSVANRSRPQYHDRVLERKMLFVTGSGIVQGIRYDLSKFNITLRNADLTD